MPKWGEYERTTATALNAYIGPIASGYLGKLDNRLREKGYLQGLQITQCGGGTISVERAMAAPLLTLDSGPVSGVTGSLYLGRAMGCPNIITTDMGGTSFDVGLIAAGKPAFSFSSVVNQYEYFIPKVDIQAIGAGGGSLVRIDEKTKTMRVGPESAGAVPGPVCYGRGGRVPTVTDADLVLGMIGADNFAGGRMKLDRAGAETALAAIGARLGMSALECAAGIAKIVEFQMADIIRKMTVGKGADPRDFVLFAFGGAGPVHAGVFARELGVSRVVIPQRETASVWCAFGAASADVLHIHESVDIQASPFDGSRIDRALDALAAAAHAQLAKDGIGAARQRLEFALDMRHKGQINEVEVVAAVAPRRGWVRGAVEGAVLRTLRTALRQRRLVPRRARRNRDIPRPRLGRDAAAETRRIRAHDRRHSRVGAAKRPRGLLGGAEAARTHARFRWRNSAARQPHRRPRRDRDAGHEHRAAAGPDDARRCLRQFRDYVVTPPSPVRGEGWGEGAARRERCISQRSRSSPDPEG